MNDDIALAVYDKAADELDVYVGSPEGGWTEMVLGAASPRDTDDRSSTGYIVSFTGDGGRAYGAWTDNPDEGDFQVLCCDQVERMRGFLEGKQP